ncbi:PilZ domain-containing protein [Wenzhouxiangella sp. AB-CW3]|uniref:PilZ domain-containing protein n=1 Tax=Wenzhouxiangella sp. AB-CW3 TaxID=2771012 RepID=UPI00168A7B9A|nr:PilZ domain-containing protein [Wenzhouxiangella sp. AB-CW3]QOC22334.1 PilZ domain-containing protein [Wenzhouxiangella sp. AB-CW3]
MSPVSERRRFHRFPFQAQALLRVGDSSRVPAVLLDISLNGALLEVPGLTQVSLEENAGELGLSVRGEINGAEVSMTMEVSVVRIEAERLACRFRGVDPESFSSLKLLIEDNLGDVSLLDRELTQLDYWPGLSLRPAD